MFKNYHNFRLILSLEGIIEKQFEDDISGNEVDGWVKNILIFKQIRYISDKKCNFVTTCIHLPKETTKRMSLRTFYFIIMFIFVVSLLIRTFGYR